jgi:hypothetical protein
MGDCEEDEMSERVEQHVPIRLYRFRGRTRWRWGAQLPTVAGGLEGYGATPDEALRALTEGLELDDLAALLDAALSGGSLEQEREE